MKLNLFEKVDSGGFLAYGLSSVEDDLIEDIDEQSMSEDEILVKKFKFFLGENRLSLEQFEQLSEEEKIRLRKEFTGD